MHVSICVFLPLVMKGFYVLFHGLCVVECSLVPYKDRDLGPLGSVAPLCYIGGKGTGSESDGLSF